MSMAGENMEVVNIKLFCVIPQVREVASDTMCWHGVQGHVTDVLVCSRTCSYLTLGGAERHTAPMSARSLGALTPDGQAAGDWVPAAVAAPVTGEAEASLTTSAASCKQAKAARAAEGCHVRRERRHARWRLGHRMTMALILECGFTDLVIEKKKRPLALCAGL